MGPRLMAAALAVLLAVSGIAAVAAPAAASGSCERAQHDAFLHDSFVNEYQNESSVTSTVRNTKATIKDADAFVRVELRNPNGYCVKMVLEVDRGIVEPADLGYVGAANATGVDDPPEAEWRAIQNLDTGETRTVIEVTAPPGSTITYAPSKARVVSLSWTGEAKDRTSSVRERVGGFFGYDYALEKNEYQLSRPEDRSSTTVQLSNDDGETVEEWHATYETADGAVQPVETDSSDPVYYRKSGDTVRFEWADDSNANVTFVANPGPVDKMEHSARAYFSSGSWLSDTLGGLFGTVAPRGGLA